MTQPTKTTPKKRRDWRPAFLRALAKWPSVTHAAKAAHIDRSTTYAAYRTEPPFAEQWDAALAEGVGAVEDTAWERTRTDTTMMIFMLKSHKPDVYRETVNQKHTGDVRLTVDLNSLIEKAYADNSTKPDAG